MKAPLLKSSTIVVESFATVKHAFLSRGLIVSQPLRRIAKDGERSRDDEVELFVAVGDEIAALITEVIEVIDIPRPSVWSRLSARSCEQTQRLNMRVWGAEVLRQEGVVLGERYRGCGDFMVGKCSVRPAMILQGGLRRARLACEGGSENGV